MKSVLSLELNLTIYLYIPMTYCHYLLPAPTVDKTDKTTKPEFKPPNRGQDPKPPQRGFVGFVDCRRGKSAWLGSVASDVQAGNLATCARSTRRRFTPPFKVLPRVLGTRVNSALNAG